MAIDLAGKHRARVSLALLLAAAVSGCRAERKQPDAATTTDTAAVDSARATGAPDSAPRSAARCQAEATAADRTICGRDRLGPLRASTTRAALDSLFGTGALMDRPVQLGEGETGPGTLINRGQPDSASVVWSDSTRSRIRSVLALGPAWRTEQGLGVGSSLEEIVNALGPQVTLLGYGWDYGGTVLLAGTALENSGIFFRTQARRREQAPEAWARVRGDQPFPATSADVRALDPVVYRVDVNWN